MDKQGIAYSSSYTAEFQLIPPLSSQFGWHPGDAAHNWALDNRYLNVQGLPECAHGLYLFASCPGECISMGFFDHVSLWIEDGIDRGQRHVRAFILSQPYLSDKDLLEAKSYAVAHGLTLQHGDGLGKDSGWYGGGTTPLRFEIKPNWPLWPIEREAATSLNVMPVSWPDDKDWVTTDG